MLVIQTGFLKGDLTLRKAFIMPVFVICLLYICSSDELFLTLHLSVLINSPSGLVNESVRASTAVSNSLTLFAGVCQKPIKSYSLL